MVSYASPRHNFRVTEDHRMLVRFGGDGEFGITHAKNIVGTKLSSRRRHSGTRSH